MQVQAEHFRSSHLLVALLDGRPFGFLRFVVQRLGEDEERPPIVFRGRTLNEAKIIAFGIQPSLENDSASVALRKDHSGPGGFSPASPCNIRRRKIEIARRVDLFCELRYTCVRWG